MTNTPETADQRQARIVATLEQALLNLPPNGDRKGYINASLNLNALAKHLADAIEREFTPPYEGTASDRIGDFMPEGAGEPLTYEVAAERLAAAMVSAIKRFETIQETNPEIAMDADLRYYREALGCFLRIPSLSKREKVFAAEPAVDPLMSAYKAFERDYFLTDDSDEADCAALRAHLPDMIRAAPECIPADVKRGIVEEATFAALAKQPFDTEEDEFSAGYLAALRDVRECGYDEG